VPTVPVEVSPILEALDAEMAHFWMGVSGGLKIPRPMALIRSDVVDGSRVFDVFAGLVPGYPPWDGRKMGSHHWSHHVQ
jgi:hypothetical protein